MSKTAALLTSSTSSRTTSRQPASSPPQNQTPDQTQKPTEKLSVGRELLDTTWRMTVPVVLFAGLGIIVDRTVGSRPWVTLLGTVVGFVFAMLLVKKQIERS